MKHPAITFTLIAVAAIHTALPADAHDFESEGLFYNITSENTCEVARPADETSPYGGDIIIPSVVNNGGTSLTVTAIAPLAFANADELKSISVPATITKIGNDAFANSTRIKTLDIESLSAWCVTEFANAAANPMHIRQYSTSYECKLRINGVEATDISIPDDVEAISPHAFTGCRTYGRLILTDNLKEIGAEAFAWGGFKTLEIGKGLETIGKGAFMECAITDVCIENLSHWCRIKFLKDPNLLVPATSNPLYKPDAHSVYSPRNLLVDGQLLTDLVIPDDVTVVEGSFCGYAALKSVSIPDHVISLAPGICQSCENLVSATLGEGLTEIPDAAFSSAENLTELSIGSHVAIIGKSAFSMCYALPEVKFPANLRQIKDQAFVHCRSITGLDFPDGITLIDQGAFGFCSSLEYINLPESVEKIGFAAFYPNSVVRNVRSYSPAPPSLATVQPPFSADTYKSATLSVPAGAGNAYRDAPGWKNFANIEESLPAGMPNSATAIDSPAPAVCITGQTITFANLPDNASYNIHDLTGRLVASGSSKSVTLPVRGIFIIDIAGNIIKIAL